jgi:hypothetical protein
MGDLSDCAFGGDFYSQGILKYPLRKLIRVCRMSMYLGSLSLCLTENPFFLGCFVSFSSLEFILGLGFPHFIFSN